MFERPLLPILIAFTIGILCSTLLLPSNPSFFFLCLGLICLVLVSLLFCPNQIQRPLLLLLFLLFGILLAGHKEPDSILQSMAASRSHVVLEGVVTEAPTLFLDKARLIVKVEKLIGPGAERALNEKIQVTTYSNIREFSPGDKIRFPARLGLFTNFNNPGRYDHLVAMELKGLVCSASVNDGRYIVPMGKGVLPFPWGLIERYRSLIRDFFKERLALPERALMRALILGEKQEINPELRDPFNRTGLAHLLVVSGLHIGLVAGFFFFSLRWLLMRSYRLALFMDIRKGVALITMLPVIIYGCLTGLEFSSQRAMIMVLAYLFSILIGREKDVWSTFGLAALVILAINPQAVFSISFQLSFGAVAGILWLAPVLFQWIPKPKLEGKGMKQIVKRLYIYCIGLVTVTLGATIFLLPLTSYYFYRNSLVSVPANLSVVPFFGIWIIPLGLMSAFILPLSPALAGLLLKAATWGLKAEMVLIQFWAGFEHSALWTIRPNLLEIGLFYGLLFFVFFFKRWAWCRIGLIAVILAWGADTGYWLYQTRFNQTLRVTYLDVGQGNAALVQFPGHERMLIDGGGFPQDDFDVGQMVVAPALFSSKIARIDYLVLSHPEADHLNGLRFIAAHFKAKEFWWNGDQGKDQSFQELMQIVEDKKIRKFLPGDLQEGREIAGAKIKVLHPLPESATVDISEPSLSANNRSLVLRLEYAGQSFLFPGDLEIKGEKVLLANFGQTLQSQTLLACHHGSKSSNSESFLTAVKPKLCVISVGSRNAFGFPHPTVLKRLQQLGCQILRIDQTGAIRIQVGSGNLKVKTFLRSAQSSQEPDQAMDQEQE